ncbi:MAG: adenosylhomocysteinase [Candidatus Hodarchaeaceae archaeon]|nr:adenosylhomocysteinase [Candidatus Hodarchaeaceae archaeon]
MKYEVKDIKLAPEGRRMIEWAERHMPVLMTVRRELSKTRDLEGLVVGAALHVEAKTAALVRALMAAGARVAITSCNPLSTRDEVAAALAEDGANVYAWRGESEAEYYANLGRVLRNKPNVLIDDGADLISLAHTKYPELIPLIRGASEETTTGVNRLRAMATGGTLRFPVIAVNDSPTKRLFDNRFGTAESTLQAIMGITNILIAGKNVVVVGYGFVGRGISSRAKGMGAIVTVVESDAVKALEAVMDGFRVMPMADAARVGDIFITATGNLNVIRREHMRLMHDGAILCNAGHFNVEIDLKGLSELAVKRHRMLDDIEEFQLKDGRRLYLLAEGRLVNLAGRRSLGHPIEIMDMSFSLQALSVEYLAKHGRELENRVYDVPNEIDRKVAELKLRSLKVELEKLRPEQVRYLKSWRLGT